MTDTPRTEGLRRRLKVLIALSIAAAGAAAAIALADGGATPSPLAKPGSSSSISTSSTQASIPAAPDRRIPPPATAAVDGRTRQMAIGSYCWRISGHGTCQRGKPRPGPTLLLHPDDRVLFTLGFKPERVRIVFGKRTHRLRPATVTTWGVPSRIPKSGQLTLEARGRRGSVAYIATLINR